MSTDPAAYALETHRVDVRLVVNGVSRHLACDPRLTLLDALREHWGLTGAKRGCGRGECGSCTVLLDGRPIYACIALACQLDGATVTTIEGLSSAGRLHPVQKAFAATDALQCGFCTPGQVLSIVALLARHPHPTPLQITAALSGNLCRCGTYPKILRAVRALSRRRRGPRR